LLREEERSLDPKLFFKTSFLDLRKTTHPFLILFADLEREEGEEDFDVKKFQKK